MHNVTCAMNSAIDLTVTLWHQVMLLKAVILIRVTNMMSI